MNSIQPPARIHTNNSAPNLSPEARKNLAIQALSPENNISKLSRENNVSRKFLYSQKEKGSSALHSAFQDKDKKTDDRILFHIPVTKRWIRQFVLALVLIGHCSFRNVIEILDSVFDYQKISLGTIHNIIDDAVIKAKAINSSQNLSSIRFGAHDEIFQTRKPVLVGMDTESTYCYLLASEKHRDETTWGVHLLDLVKQGLQPDYTIADAGKGLRAGQSAAWPDIPCHGDVFHPILDLGRLGLFLENRAFGAITYREKLERKMEKARKNNKGQKLSKKLAIAKEKENIAIEVADDIAVLVEWLKNDILSLHGPDYCTRCELFDFVVTELQSLEPFCPHRIRPVRRSLENQRDDLLAFACLLDKKIVDIAKLLKIPTHLAHSACLLLAEDKRSNLYWLRKDELRQKLGEKFYPLEQAIKEALRNTPRASSIVENLNSRLRNYFFLRRHIGNDYLHLLKFFLNHRRFMRSERSERVGKSPAELLNRCEHPHWLELLGYNRFVQN